MSLHGLAIASHGAIDARPILERNSNSTWSRAEQKRDELYDAFEKAIHTESLDALVLKSGPFEYPPWVKVTCWLPQDGRSCTQRVGAVVTVDAKPHHRHELEYGLRYTHNGKEKSLRRIAAFTAATAQNVVRFLLRRGGKPDFVRFRDNRWHFWRPVNRVEAARPDSFSSLATLITSVGGIGLFTAGGGVPEVMLGALAVLGAGVFMHWQAGQRQFLVRSDGKPRGEPRRLARVDSWQTILFGAGSRAMHVRQRFIECLHTRPVENFKWEVERVWYWGLDGKEEREQLVLTAGRGLVFCQVYQYGGDLYVGWDGHVNHGQWTERTIARGVDRKLRLPVEVTTVQPGWQAISEYDLMDLSCLMEWTHAQMVKLCKDLVQELRIDQEIDFKILRGQRQDLTRAREGTAPKRIGEKLSSAFKRTG